MLKVDLNRVKMVPVFAKKKKADEADHRALSTPAPPISMLIGLCFTSAEAVRKKNGSCKPGPRGDTNIEIGG